ncbi:484_t:CDS:2, partial [Entrophospora sp. SA101]
SPSGLSLNPHPFNVINLAYHLHNLKKYQKPITSCWLYQLTTAKQYLERRELHLTFTNWFVEKLEGSRNVPEGYLHKWKTSDTNSSHPLPNGYRAHQMPDMELLDLAQRMQIGIEKTLNVFKKWMITWTKFPLCICSLGGEHGPKFAQAVLHVILSHPLPDEQPIIVKQYIERLNENLKDKGNSFGF